VERAEVGVLEEADEVSLGRLLEGEDGVALEPELGIEVLGDLADEALEGELADEELGGLLVLANLAESDGTGPVAVGLRLRATDDGVGFPSRLGGEQMARGLASGGLTGGLFGTSHVDCRLGFSVSFFKKKGGAGAAPWDVAGRATIAKHGKKRLDVASV